MKITAVESIRLEEFPNLLWVEIHTDEGLTGLGEAFYGPEAAEAHLHEIVAPYLLGKDPRLLDKHSKAMVGYIGFASSGAETRAASAADIALWDIWGQATNQPIHALLGGATWDSVRAYNTCAGYQYVRSAKQQSTKSFGLPGGGAEGPYEDLDGFLNRADELAQSLLEMGIDGMKIWPFDYAAEKTGGQYIAPADLKSALQPFEKIRKAVGDKMDIMVELHSQWGLTAAKRIARALADYEPFWFEDPIKMDNLKAVADFARSTPIPVTASETLGYRGPFRDLFEREAVGICMFDLSWCGGITEAKKICTMAEAYSLPIAPHDCTGPVLLTASVHLAQNATNTLVQEVVRAFYYGWYDEIVTALPPLQNGRIRAPEGAGLGLRLLPDVKKRPDAHSRISKV